MDKKLTLSLNESVIKSAKLYAKKNKVSLSKLIESYLKSISQSPTKDLDITPLVESLSGVIELPENSNSKEDYTNYLIEKYK